MFHADHLDGGVDGFNMEGDAGDQSPAAHRNKNAVGLPFALFQQLHPHSRLPGDDQRMIVRRDELPALRGGQGPGEGLGLVVGVAVQQHLGLQPLHGVDLDVRRRLGHHHGGP